MHSLRTNWEVRIYDQMHNLVCSWYIENRTEHEADDEASADVARDYPDFDWSLTEVTDPLEIEA